jgi:hypothetical protein
MAVLTALSYPTIILLTAHLTATWHTPLYLIEELPLSPTAASMAVPTIRISLRTIHMVLRTLHTHFKTLPRASATRFPVQHYTTGIEPVAVMLAFIA